MAELTSLLRLTNKLLLQKALIFVFFTLVLLLFPSQKPELGTNRTILDRIWELLQLLFIGVVISYGLFSRRNTEMVTGKEFGFKPDNRSSYVSQFIPGLDEKEEGDYEEEEERKLQQQIWSNRVDVSKPSVVVNKPLSLPVRGLNRRTGERVNHESSTVLPSPIPWRSRFGRVEPRTEYSAPSMTKPLNISSNPLSKRLSPSPSLSPTASRTLIQENSEKKKTLYKELKSPQPPAPPPLPPPPFLGHASYRTPFTDRRKKSSSMRSFKDELKDVSMRTKPRPRISLDSSSSSSPLLVVPKSVRTFRPKETQTDPVRKTLHERRREEDILERFTISSDSDKVSETTDSEIQEVETEEYSDKEMIEKPKSGTAKLEEKKKKKNIQQEEEEHEEQLENEVDKKADEFIAKFREQIRLQRIESIKRSAGSRAVKSRKKQFRD